MNSILRLPIAALLVSLVTPAGAYFHSQIRKQVPGSYVLRCSGSTRTSTLLKDGKPQMTKDEGTENVVIVRHGRQLSVRTDLGQIHGDPLLYKIIAEPNGSLLAEHLSGFNTLNTLTLDRSLKFGLLVQNGFTVLLEPQGAPISDTVSLACLEEN